MSETSVFTLMEMLQRKAPEVLDLFTARNEEEFETAFDALLERALAHLERNSKNFENLDEEGLSAVLAAALSMPGIGVYQEKHSNGHVDITIEMDHSFPARRKLCEAKIYDGPARHLRGLQQLFDRYMTGRESRGLLIVYCRKKGIAELIRGIRKHMDETLPFEQQGPAVNHILKWSFLTSHLHRSGDIALVSHVGCNLCAP